ncbi:MAG: Curli production assembly/transport component CsgG [Gemmatimonadetes bacterium]|jgi:TolB-like protein|nr:Curli production assembly/transport component CsgG [Gemmatimonadota bacterium]
MQLAHWTLVAATVAGIAAPARAASAQSAAVPSVAIVFPDHNVVGTDARQYDGFSKAVTSLLGLELGSNYAVRVVDRDQVRKLVGTVPVDRETAVRIGSAAGAQETVYGRFSSDEGGNVRVDLRVVNVATGAIDYTDRVQDRADNVLPLVHRLAARLAGGLRLTALSANHVVAIAPESLPMRDLLRYGQALDLADRGDRAGAAAAFGDVLKDFPDFMPARVGLSRLK